MRKPFVAGNWKMHKTIGEARELAQELVNGLGGDDRVETAIVPPFLAIPAVAELVEGTGIGLGAQDVYHEAAGAFTGEVSVGMLADGGCGFALVGHSERRHVLGEDDGLIRRKLDALLAGGLGVILCVGETIEEREAGATEERLALQIRAGLNGIEKAAMSRVTVAYEPVWAIGTGKTATTEQAQDAHQFIRGLLTGLFDPGIGEATRIQYGGSVKPGNAAELIGQPDVDGALVGGAALSAESFLGIIRGAATTVGG